MEDEKQESGYVDKQEWTIKAEKYCTKRHRDKGSNTIGRSEQFSVWGSLESPRESDKTCWQGR